MAGVVSAVKPDDSLDIEDDEGVVAPVPTESATDAANTETDDDAAEQENVDESDGSDGIESSAPLSRQRMRWLIGVAVGVAMTLVCGVLSVLLFVDHREVVSSEQRNADVVSATRQVVANLVTLRHDSADSDVKRIQDGSTGEFRKQMDDSTASFSALLKQGQVDSTGHATAVAVVSADEQHAEAIAAVSSTVKNAEAPAGQPRVYRVKVDLERPDGKWLVAKVEFVS